MKHKAEFFRMAEHNPYVRRAMEMHWWHGFSYEEAIEELALSLAKSHDALIEDLKSVMLKEPNQ